MTDLHAVTHRVDVDHASVHAGHVRRVAALDPLAAVGSLDVTGDDTVLAARAGDAAVVAQQRVVVQGTDDLNALWGALREIRLRPFAVGDDLEVAWGRLLNRWCRTLADSADPGDTDTAAVVTIASHDVSLAGALAHHAFAPLMCIAVRRPAGRAPTAAEGPPAVRDMPIRPMRESDLPQVTDLVAALHDHDANFGMVTRRPNARQLLGEMVTRHLERAPEWSWVVDASDGRLAAFLQADPPEHSGWIAPVVAAEPVAYLNSLYVRPEARRAGIGARLAALAHREIDAAGVAATLLHHAVPSPQSAPFWARHGYRPLWTTWQRRPAVASEDASPQAERRSTATGRGPGRPRR